MDEAPLPVEQDPAPPHVARWVLAGVITAAVFTAFITVGGASQLLNPAFGLWFTELFVFLGIPWVMLRYAGKAPAAFAGVGRPSLRVAALGTWLGLVNFFTWVVPIQSAAVQLFPASWREKFDVSQIFERQSGFELALLVSAVIAAAALGEEFFFRGTLLRSLLRPGAPARGALVVSAIVFSAFHFDPVGFVGRVELGLLFGWLYLRSGSIWPGVFAHAANNGIATALYFLTKKLAPDAPEDPELLEVLLFSGAGLVFFIPTLRLLLKRPELLAPTPPAYLAEEPARLPSAALPWVALPWLGAAALSVALLFAVDRRGVMLNVFDTTHPLPGDRVGAAEAKAELNALRKEARSGAQPVEAYEERRREAISALARAPRVDGGTP